MHEDDQKTSSWLLPYLTKMSGHPGMFLGDERVETLEAFIFGYRKAREDLGLVGLSEANEAILAEFCTWLESKVGPRGSGGWPQLVSRIDNGRSNVRTFFRLFGEFLQSTGKTPGGSH